MLLNVRSDSERLRTLLNSSLGMCVVFSRFSSLHNASSASFGQAPHDVEQASVEASLYVGIYRGEQPVAVYEVLYEAARLTCCKNVGDEVTYVVFLTFAVIHVESHHQHV